VVHAHHALHLDFLGGRNALLRTERLSAHSGCNRRLARDCEQMVSCKGQEFIIHAEISECQTALMIHSFLRETRWVSCRFVRIHGISEYKRSGIRNVSILTRIRSSHRIIKYFMSLGIILTLHRRLSLSTNAPSRLAGSLCLDMISTATCLICFFAFVQRIHSLVDVRKKRERTRHSLGMRLCSAKLMVLSHVPEEHYSEISLCRSILYI
jgi:hypothetical protein